MQDAKARIIDKKILEHFQRQKVSGELFYMCGNDVQIGYEKDKDLIHLTDSDGKNHITISLRDFQQMVKIKNMNAKKLARLPKPVSETEPNDMAVQETQ